MISYFYKDVRANSVQKLDKHRAGAWVCVENPTKDEVDFLVEKFSLDSGHVLDALDSEEMPRTEREGDTLYVFLRYAFERSSSEISTSPILIILSPKAVITICLRAMPKLEEFTQGRIDISTTQKNKLFLQILAQIVRQYDEHIINIGKRIKAIRTKLRTHAVVNQDFIDFVTIEDELNDFLSGLQPMSSMLHRLLVGKQIAFYRQDEDIVEDLTLATEQSIEACRSFIKSISSIRDSHATIASNNLNRSMKILTGATVIIALPNVFYGMYGMNVKLPFQGEWWSYFGVVGLTIILMITVYLLGRKSKIF